MITLLFFYKTLVQSYFFKVHIASYNAIFFFRKKALCFPYILTFYS